MRMSGTKSFVGKTGRGYGAGKSIDIDHPDVREASIAGWVIDEPGESGIRKGQRVYWEGGSGIAIGDEVDGCVLVAAAGSPGDSARSVVYLGVADVTLTAPEPQEPADVTGTGSV